MTHLTLNNLSQLCVSKDSTSMFKTLIIGFSFHPRSWTKTSEEKLPALVINKDGQREGNGRQPPQELERLHPQSHVHARRVDQEGGEGSLEQQGKVHEVVCHSLLEDGVSSGLANEEICPLSYNDGDKVGCVTRVF